LYLLAREFTRRMSPRCWPPSNGVTTVVLARIVLEEQIRTAQWAGAVVCLAAVVLITI
jgi:drug/metabolite transporter (DMT)-like permease